jgi:hypothetical protein
MRGNATDPSLATTNCPERSARVPTSTRITSPDWIRAGEAAKAGAPERSANPRTYTASRHFIPHRAIAIRYNLPAHPAPVNRATDLKLVECNRITTPIGDGQCLLK